MRTMIAVVMLGLGFTLSGCMQSLSGIHSSEPRQVSSFSAPYPKLVACAKEQAQNEEWNSGTAVVESIESVGPKTRLNASVYSSLVRTVLWELTLKPNSSGGTLVEYRDQWSADHIYKQAWTIVKTCANQLSAPSAQTRTQHD